MAKKPVTEKPEVTEKSLFPEKLGKLEFLTLEQAKKLTLKERRFVQEYLACHSPRKALERSMAVPNSSTLPTRSLHHRAKEMMQKPLIREAIDEGVRWQIANFGHIQERVVRELLQLSTSNIADFCLFGDDGEINTDFTLATYEQLAAVQEITVDSYMEGKGDEARPVKRVRFKLYDKKAPLELLGRRFQMWTDRIEHGGLIKVEGGLPDGQEPTDNNSSDSSSGSD